MVAGLVFLLFTGAAQGETYTYWISPCTRAATACQSGDTELARWALEAWRREAGDSIAWTASAQSDAQIRIVWEEGAGGLYGEARPIRVNGKRGAEIHVLPDTRYLGKEIHEAAAHDALLRDAIVYLTCLHETGHALGLPHTSNFDDIMYSFGYGGDIREYFLRYRRKLTVRDDIRKHSGVSPSDRLRLNNPARGGPE